MFSIKYQKIQLINWLLVLNEFLSLRDEGNVGFAVSWQWTWMMLNLGCLNMNYLAAGSPEDRPSRQTWEESEVGVYSIITHINHVVSIFKHFYWRIHLQCCVHFYYSKMNQLHIYHSFRILFSCKSLQKMSRALCAVQQVLNIYLFLNIVVGLSSSQSVVSLTCKCRRSEFDIFGPEDLLDKEMGTHSNQYSYVGNFDRYLEAIVHGVARVHLT